MPFNLSRFATDAVANNPIIQAGRLGLGSLVRSDRQHLRNAALDRTPLGLPEKTFIKAMTGGDKVTPGGIEFSDDQLARLKQAYTDQKDPSRRPVVMEMTPTERVCGDVSRRTERESVSSTTRTCMTTMLLPNSIHPMSLRTGAVPRRVVMVVT